MSWRDTLRNGAVIPAHPLALTAQRKLDERRQRALTRYYLAAGAGGVAVGVHTTQFEIRDPRLGLFEPVLELAMEELRGKPDIVKVFYLQPAVGGRILPYEFWRAFAEIENVVAIKMAPFNRYQTIDVVRAVAESSRDITLYTGNDDNILIDLLTPFRFGARTRRIRGGLLGHWAFWTNKANSLLNETRNHAVLTTTALTKAAQITDANAAIFDAAHNFHGCIPGIHEILRRQGLLEGRWCLNPEEELSLGQMEEIDRIHAAYPDQNDDEFVKEHLHEWLR